MSGAGPVAVALAQAVGLMMSATFIIYVLIIVVAHARRRYFVLALLSSDFISASTIWSMLKLAERWLGG